MRRSWQWNQSLKYSKMCDLGLRLVWGNLSPWNSCRMGDQVVYLIVTDLGSEVVVDFPLGKLVCDLCAHEHERVKKNQEGAGLRVMEHRRSSSDELVGRDWCSWKNLRDTLS